MSDVQDYPTEMKRWDVFEISMKGPSDGNPFIEQRLQGIFTGKNESIVTEGFYDGNGIYKIRFMPSFCGRYSFILKGSFLETTLSGRFVVDEAENNHGPVRTANTYHFSYEDGTPFNPVGTTSLGWHLMFDGDIAQSLDTLKKSGFNKVRFSIFPRHDVYNLDDPQYFPYEGTPMSTHVLNAENVQEYTRKNEDNHFDLKRFNTEYFRHLETCIAELAKAGMEADLVLFHPYDRWGFASMDDKENDMYLSYVINRLAGYHNIWWTLADAWDLDQNKNLRDWEHYADLLVRRDPYHHLRTIHNCREIYDSTRPWITHASIRIDDLYQCAEYVNHFRIRFHKPVIMDDLGGEGNMPAAWGSLSAEEMTRRFWETAVRGGYPGHKESYLEDPEHIWSEHGTVLRGESWKRAVFLKQILDEVPGNGLAPVDAGSECAAAVPEAEYAETIKTEYLYYFSFLRPAYRDFYIDDVTDYVVEIIDTYAMKIKRFGIEHGHFRVELPCKPYLAVRLRKAQEEDYNYVEPVEEPVEEVKEEPVHMSVAESLEDMFEEEPSAAEEKTAPAEEPGPVEQTEEPAEEAPAEETKEPVEETLEDMFDDEPEQTEEAPAAPIEETDSLSATVKLPFEEEMETEDAPEDTQEVPAASAPEETAEEVPDEFKEEEADTFTNPVQSVIDELLEGADEAELNLNSLSEFKEEPEAEETASAAEETPEQSVKEEIIDDEDDELPEIVEDSFLAKQSSAGKHHEDTLDIPPIKFGSDDEKSE